MATITREQLARLAYQAGFRGDDIWKVVAIAGRESGYNPRAMNPDRSTGDQSYGLMQINMLGKMGEDRRRALGIRSNEELYDPLTNLRAAYELYRGRGNTFYDWGPYKGVSELRGTDPMAAQAAYNRVAQAGWPPVGRHRRAPARRTFAPPPAPTFFNWQEHPELNARYSSYSPHLQAFENWTLRRYGGESAGGHVEKTLGGGSPSSHAFGAAWDWQPEDRADADAMIELVTKYPGAFGIQAIHDYQNNRVWRVGREGDLGGGWQSQEPGSHAGAMGSSTHLHFETNPDVWNRVGRRNWRMMGRAARGRYSEGGPSGGGGGGPYGPGSRNLEGPPSRALANLLEGLGVEYPNAPTPTPSLLAYLAGVGLDLSTAEDLRRTALQRIRVGTRDTRQAIRQAAGRQKENITGDLIRRGVLGSGEANTRFARQAQDVAEQRSDLARQSGQLAEDATFAYQQSTEQLRRAALQQVADLDTQQQIERAVNQANTRGARRAARVSQRQYTRQQRAQENANQQLIDFINNLYLPAYPTPTRTTSPVPSPTWRPGTNPR